MDAVLVDNMFDAAHILYISNINLAHYTYSCLAFPEFYNDAMGTVT